jgi:hypothetical protein
VKALKKPKKNASVSEMKAYLERVEKRASAQKLKDELKKKVERVINGAKK